jgi:hypothetical protein
MTTLPAQGSAPLSTRRRPQRGEAWRWLIGSLALPLLGLSPLPVQAETRTAESVWSQSDAQQRAIEQVPLADRANINQTRCQEVGVGSMGSLPRFRCTVWFEPAAPTPPAPKPASLPSATP